MSCWPGRRPWGRPPVEVSRRVTGVFVSVLCSPNWSLNAGRCLGRGLGANPEVRSRPSSGLSATSR
jgi:hypothetical protein